MAVGAVSFLSLISRSCNRETRAEGQRMLLDGYGDSITEHVKRTIVYTDMWKLRESSVTAFRKFYARVLGNIFAVGNIQGVLYASSNTPLHRIANFSGKSTGERRRSSVIARKNRVFKSTSVNQIDKRFVCLWNDLSSSEKSFRYVNSRDVWEMVSSFYSSQLLLHMGFYEILATKSTWHENKIRSLCHVLWNEIGSFSVDNTRDSNKAFHDSRNGSEVSSETTSLFSLGLL